MKLQDLTNREIEKVRTVGEHCSCWECTNQILPNGNEKKQRVVFKNNSQVILCTDHFWDLMEFKATANNILHLIDVFKPSWFSL